ncbi:hypothetical protein AWW67_01015 [Roseivirga seohaensis]|uniref:Uncharacterized protein n=2 Tax=Roseivirga seohaensis TaxID=1914963 RepID=A0A150Y4E9_9BACT|nr:hypothetical protein [Roseivirga seohaensis]KYG85847.1 hypothetical protein AWW67_01015 [Roseivirga seohaensis]
MSETNTTQKLRFPSSTLMTTFPSYIFFAGISFMAIRVILNNYGVEGEEWRVVFASVGLFLSSLFLIAPLWAKAYVKRKLGTQKKAE